MGPSKECPSGGWEEWDNPVESTVDVCLKYDLLVLGVARTLQIPVEIPVHYRVAPRNNEPCLAILSPSKRNAEKKLFTWAAGAMSDIPIQLGHYRLGKTLGIGSFGKVKRTCLCCTRPRARARSARIVTGERSARWFPLGCAYLRDSVTLLADWRECSCVLHTAGRR